MGRSALSRQIHLAGYAPFSRMTGISARFIDGELIATSRPSRKHAVATSMLGGDILPPYQFGTGGGPGGWMILDEPEISFGPNILIPDLAAWRKERFPASEETNWISVAPDWVCEVLSPKTVGLDKVRKMPIYAQHGIAHLWLVDPAAGFTGKGLGHRLFDTLLQFRARSYRPQQNHERAFAVSDGFCPVSTPFS
jgi:Uma2 family endonuclease